MMRDNYIALFSHFISVGVWEAVYIIDGLLENTSDIQPDTLPVLPSMLLRKLRHDSNKNRLYRAFREVGRVIRTTFLLRYVANPQLQRQVNTVTNQMVARISPYLTHHIRRFGEYIIDMNQIIGEIPFELNLAEGA